MFSPDSKFMTVVSRFADLLLLNLVFLLTCLPVFTIGAAQAGLYSGIRTLQDPDAETTPTKAFFKGLTTGFKDVTLAWCAFTLLRAVLVVTLFMLSGLHQSGMNVAVPFWGAVIGLVLLILFQTPVALFHARFTCTARQLLRNGWFLAVAHPLRSILSAALLWLPVFLLVFHPFLLMASGIVLFVLYYGVTGLLIFNIMKKPFQTLIDHFNETHTPETP
jgi:uncharacterized membrane protein YesL